jgi:hypothetical protein
MEVHRSTERWSSQTATCSPVPLQRVRIGLAAELEAYEVNAVNTDVFSQLDQLRAKGPNFYAEERVVSCVVKAGQAGVVVCHGQIAGVERAGLGLTTTIFMRVRCGNVYVSLG